MLQRDRGLQPRSVVLINALLVVTFVGGLTLLLFVLVGLGTWAMAPRALPVIEPAAIAPTAPPPPTTPAPPVAVAVPRRPSRLQIEAALPRPAPPSPPPATLAPPRPAPPPLPRSRSPRGSVVPSTKPSSSRRFATSEITDDDHTTVDVVASTDLPPWHVRARTRRAS